MTKYSSVALNPMVRRQTAKSRFSHFEPTSGDAFDELLKLIAASLNDKDADVKVVQGDSNILNLRLPEHVCEGRFFSSVIKLEPGMQLRSEVAVRKGGAAGELPFVHTVVVGAKKTPSKWVNVILYHRDALKVEERTWTPPGKSVPETVDADWQVIAVNVHITQEDAPPTPQAMARNHAAALGLPEGVGGTPRNYSPEDYMAAQLFWSCHAMVADEE